MADTVCHKFLETCKKYPQRTALMSKRGSRWNELDWAGYQSEVESIAAGLQAIGIKSGDRVAILANTCQEWASCDLAILGMGAVTVPIYYNSTPDDISHILNDSEAKVLIGESPGAIAKIQDSINKAKSVSKIICFKQDKTSSSAVPAQMSLAELKSQGEVLLKKTPNLYELSVRKLTSDDMATIIYTSGTTGRPKGVVLTHMQGLSEVSEAFPLLGVTSKDVSLCFLPYAHILGRIEIWGHAFIGYTMAFAESIDRIKDNLIDIKPTILIAVPRIFEKIHDGILAQAEIGNVRRRVFHWALDIGRQVSHCKVNKEPVPIELGLQYRLAKKLVFDTISSRMGGRLRFAVSGGAPLSQPIAEFFHAAGILILEGYGLTETTAAIAVNTPFDYRFGTVGKPIGDVHFKIAADGEILAQSKKIMKCYYKNEQATNETIVDGWFHTGDIGEISPDGFLKITDRKKDLIKTAGGKYVAPQKLDGLLKANRFISNVHIHGDQKKYIVALLTLNWDDVERYARDRSISFKTHEDLANNPKIRDLIRDAVAEANSHLSSFESIKTFAILPNEFTVESGELTPSLKVKRKVVDQNYKTLIDSLYNGSGAGGTSDQ